MRHILQLLGAISLAGLLVGCAMIAGKPTFTGNNGKMYNAWVRTKTLQATGISIETYWEPTEASVHARTDTIRYRAVNDADGPRGAMLEPTVQKNCRFVSTPANDIPPGSAREIGYVEIFDKNKAFTFNYRIKTFDPSVGGTPITYPEPEPEPILRRSTSRRGPYEPVDF